MIIDGETYACEACVRGHRVRNCQHHDRPLQPISKKGRPVSQCQHCRAMRKSRSAHVKCGCGKKTNNAMRQKESLEGGKESCYCNYGGCCICAYKREQPQLDMVPESCLVEDSNSSDRPKGASVHSLGTNTVYSHSLLSLDENGHRSPASEHADTPQMREDYELIYDHSLDNTSSLGNGSVNNFTHTNDGDSRRGSLAAYESHQEHGRVTLAAVAPVACQSNISTASQQLDTQLPLLDASNIEYPANANFELIGDLSHATQSMFSAQLSASSIDWTNFGLSQLSSHHQTENFNDFDSDWFAQPTLATIDTSTWGGVPGVGDLGTSAEVLRQNTASLSEPVLHGGLDATIAFFEAECSDG